MIFEVAVVLVVLLSIAWGIHKGFAWQLASIVSVVSGFLVALPLSKPLAGVFGSTAPLNRFLALAVLYAVTSASVYLLAHYYRKTIQGWELDKWDDHLGGVLGAVKGYLLCTVATFFLITLSDRLHDSILRTGMGKLMGETIHVVSPLLPEEVHAILHTHIEDLEDSDGKAAGATHQCETPAKKGHSDPH